MLDPVFRKTREAQMCARQMAEKVHPIYKDPKHPCQRHAINMMGLYLATKASLATAAEEEAKKPKTDEEGFTEVVSEKKRGKRAVDLNLSPSEGQASTTNLKGQSSTSTPQQKQKSIPISAGQESITAQAKDAENLNIRPAHGEYHNRGNLYNGSYSRGYHNRENYYDNSDSREYHNRGDYYNLSDSREYHNSGDYRGKNSCRSSNEHEGQSAKRKRSESPEYRNTTVIETRKRRR